MPTGDHVKCPGEACGEGLTATAALESGLRQGIAVATSIIDAHAGGLGMSLTRSLLHAF